MVWRRVRSLLEKTGPRLAASGEVLVIRRSWGAPVVTRWGHPFVLPLLHHVEPIAATLHTIDAQYVGRRAPRLADHTRAEALVALFVRLGDDEASVLRALHTIGSRRVSAGNVIRELFEPRLEESLRRALSTLTFEEALHDRAQLAATIARGVEAEELGFVVERVALRVLRQLRPDELDPDDPQDVLAIQHLTAQIGAAREQIAAQRADTAKREALAATERAEVEREMERRQAIAATAAELHVRREHAQLEADTERQLAELHTRHEQTLARLQRERDLATAEAERDLQEARAVHAQAIERLRHELTQDLERRAAEHQLALERAEQEARHALDAERAEREHALAMRRLELERQLSTEREAIDEAVETRRQQLLDALAAQARTINTLRDELDTLRAEHATIHATLDALRAQIDALQDPAPLDALRAQIDALRDPAPLDALRAQLDAQHETFTQHQATIDRAQELLRAEQEAARYELERQHDALDELRARLDANTTPAPPPVEHIELSEFFVDEADEADEADVKLTIPHPQEKP